MDRKDRARDLALAFSSEEKPANDLDRRLERLNDLKQYKKGRQWTVQLSTDAERTTVLQLLRDLDKDASGELSLLELREAAGRSAELAAKCASLSEAKWREILSQAERICLNGVLRLDELASVFTVRPPLLLRFFNAVVANRVELGIFTLIAYIGLGVSIYARNSVYPEGHPNEGQPWTRVDSLYFVLATVTTTGYGDFAPGTDGMKIFTIFYIMVGIAVVGGILGEISKAMVAKRAAAEDTGTEMSLLRKYGPRAVGALGAGIGNVVMGAVVVTNLEDWPLLDGLYWAVVTVTTVGYGDLKINAEESRAFACVFMFASAVLVGWTVGQIAQVIADVEIHHRKKRISALSPETIARMDTDGNGVSEVEFLCFCLVELSMVDERDLQDLLSVFHRLDQSGDGMLSAADIMELKHNRGPASPSDSPEAFDASSEPRKRPGEDAPQVRLQRESIRASPTSRYAPTRAHGIPPSLQQEVQQAAAAAAACSAILTLPTSAVVGVQDKLSALVMQQRNALNHILHFCETAGR
jgi:hypothetical protein